MDLGVPSVTWGNKSVTYKAVLRIIYGNVPKLARSEPTRLELNVIRVPSILFCVT